MAHKIPITCIKDTGTKRSIVYLVSKILGTFFIKNFMGNIFLILFLRKLVAFEIFLEGFHSVFSTFSFLFSYHYRNEDFFSTPENALGPIHRVSIAFFISSSTASSPSIRTLAEIQRIQTLFPVPAYKVFKGIFKTSLELTLLI